MALENVDRRYCSLSKIDYSKIDLDSLRKCLAERKYLERPFVYEFYHQLRELIDNGRVNFGGSIVQAELDGKYHHHFEAGKLPDFIMYVPDTNRNLGAIEFRLASNPNRIESDLENLAEFRGKLGYPYVVEVIIGSRSALKKVKDYLMKVSKPEGEKIMIVEFDTDIWKVVAGMIGYNG